ncbi:chemotaxis protein [Corallococcus exiguus]|uniref:chemotaxis protein n=1 Tax=Corallococcus TaxID=83461 RepID=UPI000ED48469|nr:MULTISPECIES: chemotaxis protein [Corallococcus]NNB89111.1 chemotaxis protein [Corallococcus exiguus]NNB97457.1 chemotaxis protein [Corallococcus exiguus]NNC06308.1 chemotaxis protein [Corallococcus exiguus]NPC48531.1 chemotaxis protein [Corallococcus exiguus]RKH80459.1 chemotaxis protein [Corallococcus sp. AB032C]
MAPALFPVRVVTVVLLAVLCGGCATLEPRRSELTTLVGRSDLSVAAMRTRVRDLARRFSGLIEALADDLAVRSGSPRVASAMLRFKANAVPAVQSALFQPDPVAALIDTWALLAQIEESLPRTAVDSSPELLADAHASLVAMESEVEAEWLVVTGRADATETRDKVHAWAAAHPLTGPLVTRVSTTALLASLTDVTGGGLRATAAGLVEDTRDLTARVDLYATSLPRQARWQAELVATDALHAPTVQGALAELGRTVDLLDRVGALAANSPALIERERRAVLDAVHAERLGLQEFVNGERQAVFADVGRERQALVDALHAERVAALQQLDGLARGWVDHAFDRLGPLVDRVFLWLTLLAVLLGVGGLLLTRAWRRAR